MRKFFKKNIYVTAFISLLLVLYQCGEISVPTAQFLRDNNTDKLAPVYRTAPMAAVSVDEGGGVSIHTSPEKVSEAVYDFRERAGILYLIEFVEAMLNRFGDKVPENIMQGLVQEEVEHFLDKDLFREANIEIRRLGSSYFLSNDQGEKSFLVEFFMEKGPEGKNRVVRRSYPLAGQGFVISTGRDLNLPSERVSPRRKVEIRNVTGTPSNVIAELGKLGVDENTVFVDFDETLINESSPIMWGFRQVARALYSKKYRMAVKLFFSAVKKRWSYGKRGDLRSTLRLYEGTPLLLVRSLAGELTLNTGLLDTLENIKRRRSLEQLQIVVLSRNLANIIRPFLARDDIREEFRKRGLVANIIVANEIIESDDRISTAMMNSGNIIDSTTKAQYIPEGNIFIVDYSELSVMVDKRFSIDPLISRHFIVVKKKRSKKDSSSGTVLPDSQDLSAAEGINRSYVKASIRRDRTITPAILLEEMLNAGVFLNNAMTASQINSKYSSLYRRSYLMRAIAFLHAAGLITVTEKGRKYYLPDWIDRDKLKEVVEANPELRGVNSKAVHVNAVRIRVENMRRLDNSAIETKAGELEEGTAHMVNELIVALRSTALAMHRKNENVVIGIETGWIPEVQKAYIQGVLNELSRFYKKTGMGDIIIKYGDGEVLAEKVTREVIENEVPNSNVIMLGSANALRKHEFKHFRDSSDPEDRAFFMEISVPKYFPENSYIRIPEMLEKALDLWRGYKVVSVTSSLVIEQAGDRLFKFIIPQAEPLEYDLLKELYGIQRKIIESA